MSKKDFLARFGDAETAFGLMNHDDPVSVANVAKNPSLSTKQLDTMLKHEHPRVRTAVFYNPNATTDQVARGIRDANPSVQAAAVRHASATREQAQKMIDDGAKDWALQCAKNVLRKHDERA